ncbi:MAG: metabolite traffic protein EboE [Chitinophagaceae bacterium]
MQTPFGTLTYCTNIHPGENWMDHFRELREIIPGIKAVLSPKSPFGIGLRLSNLASLELAREGPLENFKKWLHKEDCYVFTMNGFPYGGFHQIPVKDEVHRPDWTTSERVQYTIRLFRILSSLLPAGMEGGVSTSPLSYRIWLRKEDETTRENVFQTSTLHILMVVDQLIRIRKSTGQLFHLDIEPEPDGLIENSTEFTEWVERYLKPMGIPYIRDQFGITGSQAEEWLLDHVQVCYDICHFSLVYEQPQEVLDQLERVGIKIGKIQISAALVGIIPEQQLGKQKMAQLFADFNEPIYLHQVVARLKQGTLLHYPDLPDALKDIYRGDLAEWRTHFHVPVFSEEFGGLQSTRKDILQLLDLQKKKSFTNHLEVETYTWEVLPAGSSLPLKDSIIRELDWVKNILS